MTALKSAYICVLSISNVILFSYTKCSLYASPSPKTGTIIIFLSKISHKCPDLGIDMHSPVHCTLFGKKCPELGIKIHSPVNCTLFLNVQNWELTPTPRYTVSPNAKNCELTPTPCTLYNPKCPELGINTHSLYTSDFRIPNVQNWELILTPL